MKYVYNKPQPAVSTQFIINMVIFDVIVIILAIIGAKVFSNYMIVHDTKTINSWCSQVTCAVVDPETGNGYEVKVEAVPNGKINAEQYEVEEI